MRGSLQAPCRRHRVRKATQRDMAHDPEYGRRRFIKDSVWSVARTAHEFVTHRDAPAEKKATPLPQRNDWLRPPGAAADALFVERCTRCGDCLKACPYGSIKAHPQDGFPIILPDETPCWLCEDFPCIDVCATEALLPVAQVEDVRMGLAKIAQDDCTAGQGCNACVSRCPVHALAMDFEALRVQVTEERCVGCGLCEQTCKTVNDRIAIRIVPARILRPDDRGIAG
jgi:ferredoxin-type protein NapG